MKLNHGLLEFRSPEMINIISIKKIMDTKANKERNLLINIFLSQLKNILPARYPKLIHTKPINTENT